MQCVDLNVFQLNMKLFFESFVFKIKLVLLFNDVGTKFQYNLCKSKRIESFGGYKINMKIRSEERNTERKQAESKCKIAFMC